MSASTRTIQQPMGIGSITRAAAMVAVGLAAALSIGWGASNLIGSTSVRTPVQAPIVLDKGGRGDLVAPKVGPAPGAYIPSGGNLLKDDNASGTKQSAPVTRHSGFRPE